MKLRSLPLFVLLYLSVCVALRLRSLPFPQPVYVASRSFSVKPTFFFCTLKSTHARTVRGRDGSRSDRPSRNQPFCGGVPHPPDPTDRANLRRKDICFCGFDEKTFFLRLGSVGWGGIRWSVLMAFLFGGWGQLVGWYSVGCSRPNQPARFRWGRATETRIPNLVPRPIPTPYNGFCTIIHFQICPTS